MTSKKQETGFSMNNIFVYLLVTVSLMLGAWTLTKTSEHGEQLSSLKTLPAAIEKLDKTLDGMNTLTLRMDEKVKKLEEETFRDDRQDESIKKQWELYSNIKDRVIKLELALENIKHE